MKVPSRTNDLSPGLLKPIVQFHKHLLALYRRLPYLILVESSPRLCQYLRLAPEYQLCDTPTLSL